MPQSGAISKARAAGQCRPGHPFTSVLASRAFAEALAPPNHLVELGSAGAWLIRRSIGETGLFDAISPYPYSACRHWSRLDEDAARLSSDLVSLTWVTPPEPCPAYGELVGSFDVVREYKRHWLVELERIAPSVHHRREASRALRRLTVTPASADDDSVERWIQLYDVLCERHRIEDSARLDRWQLSALMRFPAIRAYEARAGSEVCAMALWVLDGDIVHYFLAASSLAGYRVGAGYALMQVALNQFAEERRSVACLGSVPDGQDARSGLGRFKSGWTRRTAPTWLCGRILQHDTYARLAGPRGAEVRFPAYRYTRAA